MRLDDLFFESAAVSPFQALRARQLFGPRIRLIA